MPRLSHADALNEILALHYRALPNYLRDAHPWTREGDEAAADVIRHIAADHQRIVDLASEGLLEANANIRLGELPMLYTDVHDLSYQYILRMLIDEQRLLIDRLQKCVDDSGGEPLALEALGMAKGHLEELQETLASPSVT